MQPRLLVEVLSGGRQHGIGVNSGTSGLHLCLDALGIGPGDEVITPAFSFVASANCILYTGATPVFVDCDPRTLNVNLNGVERKITERTKAIIGVEVFGNPAGMPELAAICAKYELPLIEDSCEGFGGRYKDEPVGGFGRLAVFGFYPNKQVTTGEGGMIVTDDDRLADLCRSLRNQGRPDDSSVQATRGWYWSVTFILPVAQTSIIDGPIHRSIGVTIPASGLSSNSAIPVRHTTRQLRVRRPKWHSRRQ